MLERPINLVTLRTISVVALHLLYVVTHFIFCIPLINLGVLVFVLTRFIILVFVRRFSS